MKSQYVVQSANSNSRYYVRESFTLTIEVLQPTKSHRERTVEWVNGEISLFKERIGVEGGVVRVYHDI